MQKHLSFFLLMTNIVVEWNFLHLLSLAILFLQHVDHILLSCLYSLKSLPHSIYKCCYCHLSNREWKQKKNKILWKLTAVMSQIEGCFCCFFWSMSENVQVYFVGGITFYLALLACLLACSSLNVKNILIIEHKELITQIMKFIQRNIKQSY